MANSRFSFYGMFKSLLTSLVFFVSLQLSAQAIPGWLQKIRPLNGSTIVMTPEGGHAALLQAVNSARQSLYMEIYHLTDPQLVQAMVAARARGVDVQVIYDSRSLESPHYQQYFAQLQAGKVLVMKSSAGFSITHSKTFLVDKKLLFISTMNFVGHFDAMRDYGLFTADADMIREWLTIFATDIQNAKTNGTATPPLSNPNLIVSPVNAEQKLVDLINVARVSIHGNVENLGNENVMNALANAARRGVKVQFITPECDLNFDPLHNYPYMYALAKAGVESRVMPSPSSPQTPYMHAKVLTVDGKVAYLGSENFSFNSLRQAREIGVVFSNPQLVRGLEQMMNHDWTISKPLPATPPTICKVPGT